MATISEIRSKYPDAYSDMSDKQLADAMYKKHYSDMPRAEFDKQVGLTAARPAAPTPAPSANDAAYQAALEASKQRDAKVPKFIPTGYETPETGELENRQSQKLLQGFTYNTADEMASILAAAKTGVSNALGHNKGITPRQAYDAQMRLEQEQMQKFGAEHPTQSAGWGITGALLNPLTYEGAKFAAKGATIPAIAGRTAGMNAAQGALSGAGEGTDLKSRIKGAALGAAIGGAVGGVTSAGGRGISNALANRATIKGAPSVDVLKDQAENLYTQAENAGVIIKKSIINKFAKSLTKDMSEQGITPELHPNAFDSLKRINNITNNLTLKGAEIERRILQNRVADAGAAARMGKSKDDLRIARMIVDKYDDFIENLHPQSTLAGTSSALAVAILKEARAVYAQKAKGETIQTIIDKAKQNSNITTLEQELRKGFRKLANNDLGISRFSESERKAIRDVANGTLTRNALTTIGRLAPSMTAQGNLVGTAEIFAALSGHGAPVAAMLGAGIPAKVASTASTLNAAKLAGALARGATPVAPNKTVPPLAAALAGALARSAGSKKEQ